MDEINAVQLLPKITKELNFTKCLICRSNKKSEPKLTSSGVLAGGTKGATAPPAEIFHKGRKYSRGAKTHNYEKKISRHNFRLPQLFE